MGLKVLVREQVVGNCAAHNLVQAIRFCERTYPAKADPKLKNLEDLRRTRQMCAHLLELINTNYAVMVQFTDEYCVSKAQELMTVNVTALAQEIVGVAAVGGADAL